MRVCGMKTTQDSPLWQTEFPDFPPADMPPIPSDWRDSSWHNDTCPSFVVITFPPGSMYQQARAWIAESDPARREFATMHRFSVTYEDVGGMGATPFTTNHFGALLAYVEAIQTRALADAFGQLIRAELAPHLAEIRRRNALPEYAAACASHDFCDSNMLMVQAWENTFGGEPDASDEAHARRINAAWSEVRAKGFAE